MHSCVSGSSEFACESVHVVLRGEKTQKTLFFPSHKRIERLDWCTYTKQMKMACRVLNEDDEDDAVPEVGECWDFAVEMH